jgi:DNA-binding transcriptional MerR regulator
MSRPRNLETIAQAELVTIGELVRLSGMRYSTLKYYTEIGLLPFRQLDAGLVRRYPREASLRRLEEIRVCKERDGMTILQIVERYASAPQNDARTGEV